MQLIRQNASLVVLIIIICAIPAIFLDTTWSMIRVWESNETFTHGFLIFPISLWLLWQKRQLIAEIRISPEPRVFLLLVFVIGLWFVSAVVDVYVTQQLAMISMIIAIAWIVLGRQILMFLAFPLLFLFFAVPLGQGLIPPLMEFTANFTVTLIKMTGIPVYQDGLMFSLPSGDWSVVEECSGVRYLIASIALGTIYAYISYTALKKRLIFIGFAIFIPILANGLRAFMIVMIGHFSGMTLAVGADHLIYGWVFFGVIIFIMFYVGSFWWDPVEKPALVSTSSMSAWPRNSFIYLFSALIVVVLTQFYTLHLKNRDVKDMVHIDSLQMAENYGPWQYDSGRLLSWEPILKSPDLKIARGYRFGSDFVQLNVGFYQSQRQGAEAVTTNNRLVKPYGGIFRIVKQTDYQQGKIYVSEVIISGRGFKFLIWHWYRIGALQTPNPYIAKTFDAYNQIISGRTDASFITLATVIDDKLEDGRSRLNDFVNLSLDEINDELESLVRK